DAMAKPNFCCAFTADSDVVVATCARFAAGSLAKCGRSIDDAKLPAPTKPIAIWSLAAAGSFRAGDGDDGFAPGSTRIVAGGDASSAGTGYSSSTPTALSAPVMSWP